MIGKHSIIDLAKFFYKNSAIQRIATGKSFCMQELYSVDFSCPIPSMSPLPILKGSKKIAWDSRVPVPVI